jgi:putative ATP-dependent endonuclease of the OLD family
MGYSPYFLSASTFETIRVVRKRAIDLSKVSAWTVDQHRKLIAAAFGEEPIGELASQASLEPFIQPELAEAFFCGKLILVEGPEDRAILSTILEHLGLLDDFLRSGCHVVCSNGKPGLINMVALARGFATPHFVMFDADTGCAAADVQGTRTLNRKIATLMELPVDECAWPDANIFRERSVIWKQDIQSAIGEDYDRWIEEVQGVCAAFGWQYVRLKKNPAVVSYALSKALAAGTKFPKLEKVATSLHTFALS